MNKINEIKRKRIINYVRNFNIRVDYVGVLSTELHTLNRIESEFTLIYILKNSLTIKSGDSFINLEEGDIYYLNQEFTLLNNNDSVIQFIAFHPYNSMMRKEMNQFILSSFDPVTKDSDNIIRNYFNDIVKESEKQDNLYFEAVDKIFSLLIINIIRLSKKDYNTYKFSANNDYFLSASIYIRENINNTIKVKDIADKLNISEIYLYKIFKAHTGKSVQQFINEYKMNEAVALLDSGEYQIKDIADKLGYSSSNHFSQSFKKRFGVSPKNYNYIK